MLTQTQFALQIYSGKASRFECPQCKKQGQFTKYIDLDSGEYLADFVGRCNRETSCGYHYTPKEYFENYPEDNRYTESITVDKPKTKASTETKSTIRPIVQAVNLEPTYIDYGIFKRSVSNLKALNGNCFIQYLISLFGFDITNELINRFFIGCSNKWQGATVFWQIDSNKNVRTGRIMLYYASSGRRVKYPFNHVNWVHTELQKANIITEFNLSQCFFGEHQFLFDKQNKPVAIVESEKTAVIASVFLPDYIWLAAGGINGLSMEKCKVLSGKKVLLVPDLKAYHKWQEEAHKIKAEVSCQIIVSDLLEKNATAADREKGLDLADYLIKRDSEYGWALSANDYPLFWDS